MTREVLSPAEERFERWRKSIGFFLGPVVFLILYFLPIQSLSTQPHTLLAILGLVPILLMVRAGIIFDTVGFFVIVGGLMFLCPLMGFM